MGQYSALSDDFIIIAVSKAIVNSKTEKVEKYRRISRVVIGGQCLHRPAKGLRQHRTIPALRIKHRSGGCGTPLAVSALRIMRYCPYFLILVSRVLALEKGEGPAGKCSVFMKKSKKPAETFVSTGSVWSGRRGSNSLPPPWQGGALPDELRPHKKITEDCSVIFLLAAPVRLERTTP